MPQLIIFKVFDKVGSLKLKEEKKSKYIYRHFDKNFGCLSFTENERYLGMMPDLSNVSKQQRYRGKHDLKI